MSLTASNVYNQICVSTNIAIIHWSGKGGRVRSWVRGVQRASTPSFASIIGGRGFPYRRILSLGAMGMGAWSDSRVVGTSADFPRTRKLKKMVFGPRNIFDKK